MAKRFTDTDKYKKPFIRGLKGAYKLLWDYLYHDCNHAGIWIVDFDIAQIYIGSDMPINKSDALKFFNTDEIRVIEFDNCSKWFIPSFIDFQYGTLTETNRAHNSVISILSKYGLYKNKGLIRGLQGRKDKDKDKVMDKDILAPFEVFVNEVKNGNHRQAIEQWYMELKLKPKSLTELLNKGFKGQLLTDEKVHANTLELKRHFKNWLNTQDRVGKLDEYKLKQ